MKREKFYQLILLFTFLQAYRSEAQPAALLQDSALVVADSLVIVGSIEITGNKKTKELIILREIPFQSGEQYTLETLVNKMELARRQLMNTALFNEVIVAAKNIEEKTVHILVELTERWYLFPLPYFRPVDRNINQWLIDEKASLERVNYGAKITYNNVTGWNDKFKLWLITGYTRQLSVSYDRFYIGRDLKWGMKLAFATGKNREVNYNTVNDKQVFLKEEGKYIRNFTNASVEISYRPAIKTRHTVGLGYVHEKVGDTIVALNPVFFKSGRKSICYPVINYTMNYLNLDFNPYPTKGYSAQVSVTKNGLNNIINLWLLQFNGMGVWPVAPKTFASLNAYGGLKLPFKQPYFGQRFLGYGDVFMQGFEYFVVDGVAGGYLKATLSRSLIDCSIKVPGQGKRKKDKRVERIPLRVFGKIYGNTGYVHNPQPGENALSNRMLYSGGMGVDIVCFYNLVFRLEWSFNSLGQNGLFLHR